MGGIIDAKQTEYLCNIGAYDQTEWAYLVPDENPSLANQLLFSDIGHYKIVVKNESQIPEKNWEKFIIDESTLTPVLTNTMQ